MNLSNFGRKLSNRNGIVSLMEDLGEALNVNPDLLFLGGGNPARRGGERFHRRHLARRRAERLQRDLQKRGFRLQRLWIRIA